MPNDQAMIAMRRRCVWAAALVALLVGAAVTTPAQDQDIQQAARLAARWSRIAHEQFEAASTYPSQMSAELLEQFIVGGAVRAVRDRAGAQQLQDADAAIQRFAMTMVQAGVRQPDGRVRLGEGSFASARNKLCPIYPFC